MRLWEPSLLEWKIGFPHQEEYREWGRLGEGSRVGSGPNSREKKTVGTPVVHGSIAILHNEDTGLMCVASEGDIGEVGPVSPPDDMT